MPSEPRQRTVAGSTSGSAAPRAHWKSVAESPCSVTRSIRKHGYSSAGSRCVLFDKGNSRRTSGLASCSAAARDVRALAGAATVASHRRPAVSERRLPMQARQPSANSIFCPAYTLPRERALRHLNHPLIFLRAVTSAFPSCRAHFSDTQENRAMLRTKATISDSLKCDQMNLDA